ncbi:hypothetical protein OC846_001126 [Tilletia horrida]|uniref:Uncharacterized protein n=1 Tax=Tilletia horrida TaxID=155126 RepID=A0AAN6GWH9_9BASI|nr:hypothetical protein OC845_004525 [Tilletia horrida]KAK0556429.1 hypothetical protein OC846_001126 [Tilletia horrida]KAK0569359.1 hypothetical protein OC861_000965 [Tilletia horrida]
MHFSTIFVLTFAVIASASFGAAVETPNTGVCSLFADHGLHNLDLIGCPASSEARVVDPVKQAALCEALFHGGMENLEQHGCQTEIMKRGSRDCSTKKICSSSSNSLLSIFGWFCNGGGFDSRSTKACNSAACGMLHNTGVDLTLWGCN